MTNENAKRENTIFPDLPFNRPYSIHYISHNTVGVFLKKSLHNASFIYIKTNVYIIQIK